MELDVFKKEELTIEETNFVNLHQIIINNASLTGMYLYEFCKSLKQMRDSKIYLSAGLKNFEEYAEKVLLLKKSQGYNFCKMAENVSPEIFQKFGKNSSKILLLSQLTSDEQKEIVNNVDDSITVANLKKEIEKLKDVKKISESIEKCNDVLEEENKILLSKNDALTTESKKLNKRIKELEKELSSKENSDPGNTERIKELEKELENLKNNQQVIEKEIIKEIEVSDPKLTAKIEELENELKKKSIIENESLMKFKVIFETIKRELMHAKNMISTFNDEDAFKCKNVLKTLIEMV